MRISDWSSDVCSSDLHYKWIEMRLFEVLGGWVATVPELDVKLRLGTHCYHHAWHAELWHKRLPELREMNPERLTVAQNDELVAFVDAMTEPEAPELPIEKPVGAYSVHIPDRNSGVRGKRVAVRGELGG